MKPKDTETKPPIKEATFVGFKLMIVDGQIMTEITDVPNKRIAHLFKPSDWILLNAAINAARRGVNDTVKGIEREIGSF